MAIEQTLEELVQALEQHHKASTKVLKDLKASKDGDTWDILSVLEILRNAEHNSTDAPALSAAIARTRAEVEQGASTAWLDLEVQVRELCAEHQWQVDGQWPKLYIERALEFRVDESAHRIWIGGTALKTLTINSIGRNLSALVKELIPARFSPETFVELLAVAYNIRAQEGRSDQVPIREVYQELVWLSQPPKFSRDARTRHFVEITLDQFRARLSAALKSGVCIDSAGRELRLLPPLDPKDAVFVYQPIERRFGYVGRIEFCKREEGSDERIRE